MSVSVRPIPLKNSLSERLILPLLALPNDHVGELFST